MATQLQIRRGTAAQVAAFTGAEGEIVYNSTNDSLHTNDGATAGGFELARADLNNVLDADLNAALTGNTLSALTITTLTSGAATFSGDVDVSGANPANTLLGQVSVKSTAALANGNASGISFWANTSTGLGAYASIQTVTTGDYAGKLVFTTRNGAGVFDPRMTIDAYGNFNVARTGYISSSTNGFYANNEGWTHTSVSGEPTAYFNRNTSDGNITVFQRQGTTVGSIGANNGTIYFAGPNANTGGFRIDSSGSNGVIIPTTNTGANRDAAVDLGYSSGGTNIRFKDLYLSGTVNAGAATFSGRVSVNGTANPNSSLAILSDSGANAVEIRTRSTYNDYAFINFNSTDGSEALGALGVHRTAAATASLIFYSNDGTAGVNEAGRFDASGNLGIGTSTITNPYSQTPFTDVNIDGTWGGAISFKMGGVTKGWVGQRSSGNEDMVIGATTGQELLFYENNAEAMRISSGNLGLGVVPTALGTPKLAVVSTAADWAVHIRNEHPTLPYGIFIDYTTAQNDAGSNFLYFRDGGAIRFGVASNGGISNYQANNVNLSDRREKTNFLPSKSYLDVICAIPVQTFNYIDQNMEDDPGLTLGVVAQDVQVVAPEFVMESNWGTEEDPKMRLSLYQTDLQYALMKCIQEQQDMITALTARIEALEGA